MRPLLVGQAPSARHAPGARAFEGKGSGARLELAAGLRAGTLHESFDAVNLLPEYPGKAGRGKGDAFDPYEARRRVFNLAPRLLPSAVVLLCGRAVARAFGVADDYFVWTRFGCFVVAVIPHPSGVNRWWNCPRNRARAARFLRAVLRRGGGAPGSSRRSTEGRAPAARRARSRAAPSPG